jgi:hypothetical protein
MHECSICRQQFLGMGCNPAPFPGKRCCDHCDTWFVTPTRALLGRDADAKNSQLLSFLSDLATMGARTEPAIRDPAPFDASD